MKSLLIVAALMQWTAAAQDAKPFLGRWDMTVTPSNGTPYPQWMELLEKNGKIEGRVQPRGGAWHPILNAKVESGKIVIAVPAGRGPAIGWELTSAGPDKLTGVEKRGDSDGPVLVGVRAPKLDRPMPKAWTTPEPLFNGKDLTGWERLAA